MPWISAIQIQGLFFDETCLEPVIGLPDSP
jgi:hypothetical protein